MVQRSPKPLKNSRNSSHIPTSPPHSPEKKKKIPFAFWWHIFWATQIRRRRMQGGEREGGPARERRPDEVVISEPVVKNGYE